MVGTLVETLVGQYSLQVEFGVEIERRRDCMEPVGTGRALDRVLEEMAGVMRPPYSYLRRTPAFDSWMRTEWHRFRLDRALGELPSLQRYPEAIE